MNSDHAHIAFAAGVAALAVGSLILARTVRKVWAMPLSSTAHNRTTRQVSH